ncbi:MAG: hypothetical protein QM597_10575 [Aeromicrobium sp.]|uniref:hypothetical protein n=1 Tax=Aeromicrobium sp. TaxID=1871063 RepID=UPI0039E72986
MTDTTTLTETSTQVPPAPAATPVPPASATTPAPAAASPRKRGWITAAVATGALLVGLGAGIALGFALDEEGSTTPTGPGQGGQMGQMQQGGPGGQGGTQGGPPGSSEQGGTQGGTEGSAS